MGICLQDYLTHKYHMYMQVLSWYLIQEGNGRNSTLSLSLSLSLWHEHTEQPVKSYRMPQIYFTYLCNSKRSTQSKTQIGRYGIVTKRGNYSMYNTSTHWHSIQARYGSSNTYSVHVDARINLLWLRCVQLNSTRHYSLYSKAAADIGWGTPCHSKVYCIVYNGHLWFNWAKFW